MAEAARTTVDSPDLFNQYMRDHNEEDVEHLCELADRSNAHLLARAPVAGQKSWETVAARQIDSARADGRRCRVHPHNHDRTQPHGRCQNIGSIALLMNLDHFEKERPGKFSSNFAICAPCRQLIDGELMLAANPMLRLRRYRAPPAQRWRHNLRGRGVIRAPPPATISRRDRDIKLMERHWVRICARHHAQYAPPAGGPPPGRYHRECACGVKKLRPWFNAVNSDQNYDQNEIDLGDLADHGRRNCATDDTWMFFYTRGTGLGNRREYGAKWVRPLKCPECIYDDTVTPDEVEPGGHWEPRRIYDDGPSVCIRIKPERVDQVLYCLVCMELVWL